MPDVKDIQEICGRLDRGEIDRDQFLEAAHARDGRPDRLHARRRVDLHRHRRRPRAALHGHVRPARRPHGRRHRHAQRRRPAPTSTRCSRDGCVIASDARNHPTTAALRGQLPASRWTSTRCWTCASRSTACCSAPSAASRPARRSSGRSARCSCCARSARAPAWRCCMRPPRTIDTQPASLWEPSSPNRLLTMPVPLDSGRGPARTRPGLIARDTLHGRRHAGSAPLAGAYNARSAHLFARHVQAPGTRGTGRTAAAAAPGTAAHQRAARAAARRRHAGARQPALAPDRRAQPHRRPARAPARRGARRRTGARREADRSDDHGPELHPRLPRGRRDRRCSRRSATSTAR